MPPSPGGPPGEWNAPMPPPPPPPPSASDATQQWAAAAPTQQWPAAPAPQPAAPPWGAPPIPPPGRPAAEGRNRTPLLIAAAVVVAAVVVLVVVLATSGGKSKNKAVKAPTGVQIVSSPDGNTISWTGSDPGATYEIDRDSKSIAASVSGTSYTDNTTDISRAPHLYQVYAMRNGKKSAAGSAMSHAVIVTTTTSSSPPTPTSSGTGSSSATLSAAEQTLARSVSFVDPSSCSGLPEDEKGGVAAKVVCAPTNDTSDSPTTVFVYKLDSRAALKAVETDLYGAAPSFDRCIDPPAQHTWSTPGGPVVGNLFCGLGKTSGSPIFAWSYDDDAVFVHTQAGKAKPKADLYKWWKSVDVTLG